MTVACLGAIFWMSSQPDYGTTRSSVLADRASNLAHVPVYAALAFCWLKTVLGTRPLPRAFGVAFIASTVCAVLDEWNQAHVPGRNASLGDLVLDLAGISGMLFILYRKESRSGPLPATPKTL